MTDDEPRKQAVKSLPDEAPPGASPSADPTDVSRYPELQLWLDEARIKQGQGYGWLGLVAVLPYILTMLGLLALGLLLGWALKTLP